MKKAAALLCVFLLLCCLAVPAAASVDDLCADYFPGGVIDAPDVGSVLVDSDYDSYTRVTVTIPISDQVYTFGAAYDKAGYEDFCRQYGLEEYSLGFSAQIDYSLNSKNNWQYTPAWDDDNSNGSAFIGYDEKVQKQEVITIDSVNSEFFNTLRAAVVSGTNPDGSSKAYIDFSNNILYFRTRYCICYTPEGEAEQKYLFSDWSNVFQYGAIAEKTTKSNAPEELPAPKIDDLALLGDDGTRLTFTLEFPQSLYDAEIYYDRNGGSTGTLLAELTVNGKVSTFAVDDEESMLGGARTLTLPDGVTVKAGDKVSLRVRLTDADPLGDGPWSQKTKLTAKTVTTEEHTQEETLPLPPEEGEEDEIPIETDPADNGAEKKSDCKLCGVCPVQPLGVCLFVWLGALVLLALLIALAGRIAKKGKKGKRSKKGKKGKKKKARR